MKLATFYDGCAAHYDADYESAGYRHDIPFYVEAAKESGGPVLEMGCGTGRVLLETARAGIEVVGVELSAAMLRRAEERLAAEPAAVRDRVRLVQGDIRTADLTEGGRRFSLVTAPFRVAQHLLTREDQKAWLRNVARHLAPGGSLIFDVFQPDYGMIGESPFIAVDVERTDPETGATIRRVSRSDHRPELQTFDVTFEWLIHRPSEPEGAERTENTVRTTVRWFTLAELQNLLELEGFEVLHAWGAFDRAPFDEDAEDIILQARLTA